MCPPSIDLWFTVIKFFFYFRKSKWIRYTGEQITALLTSCSVRWTGFPSHARQQLHCAHHVAGATEKLPRVSRRCISRHANSNHSSRPSSGKMTHFVLNQSLQHAWPFTMLLCTYCSASHRPKKWPLIGHNSFLQTSRFWISPL